MPKQRTRIALIAAAATLLTAATPVAAQPHDSDFAPKVNVTVESDLKVLAEGFAAAFAEIPAGARYIWVRNGDETLIFGSVDWVKAYGGVLVVKIDSGPTHVISAADVLQITNERPRQSPK